MELELIGLLSAVVAALAGGGLAYLVVRKATASIIAEGEKRAATIHKAAEREADAMRKTATAEGKEALRAEREALDRQSRQHAQEFRAREQKLERRDEEFERRVKQKETEIDRVRERLERRDEMAAAKLKSAEDEALNVERKLKEIAARAGELDAKLEQIAGLTAEEAKRELLKRVEEGATLEAARIARRIEEQAGAEAEQRAQKIIATAVQRFSGDYVAERTVTVVEIPDDQMKGRIIGREGRNIRTFEMITGVDLIVDDTPDHVVISSHNPLRREIARRTLEKMIEDGRIQPVRIEELYQQVGGEVEKILRDQAQQAVFELGLQGLHTELVRLMGINNFRTSFSQNILQHSAEVGYICGMMADELGLDRSLARRVGFLHDIGKAVDQEFEGTHAQIGADLCKKFGEADDVVRAVAEHHDNPPSTIWGVMVQAADTLSAARPGARRESLTNYVKRLEDLENIANRYPEVAKAYAIQAGREIRIVVDSEKASDDAAYHLAKTVASEIEATLKYPGQIKVTVLRETRAIAYAK